MKTAKESNTGLEGEGLLGGVLLLARLSLTPLFVYSGIGKILAFGLTASFAGWRRRAWEFDGGWINRGRIGLFSRPHLRDLDTVGGGYPDCLHNSGHTDVS